MPNVSTTHCEQASVCDTKCKRFNASDLYWHNKDTSLCYRTSWTEQNSKDVVGLFQFLFLTVPTGPGARWHCPSPVMKLTRPSHFCLALLKGVKTSIRFSFSKHFQRSEQTRNINHTQIILCWQITLYQLCFICVSKTNDKLSLCWIHNEFFHGIYTKKSLHLYVATCQNTTARSHCKPAQWCVMLLSSYFGV